MIKVMIVEDEAGIANSIANEFSWFDMGCELYGIAQNGLEALEMCFRAVPDIVISDIVMPGINGLSFLEHIKEKHPEVQFIILTGHRDFDYAKDALNLGASSYMLKPINFGELRANIMKLIGNIINGNENRRVKNQKEQVLTNLLNGRIYHKSIISSQIQTMLSNLRCFRVAAIQFDDDRANNSERIRNLYLFCESLMDDTESVLLTKPDDTQLALIILTKQDEEFITIRSYLQQWQTRIYHAFSMTVSIGFSSVKNGHETLHDAFMEARRALGKKFFSGSESINVFISEDDVQEKADASFPKIMDLYPRIIDLIAIAGGAYLLQSADKIFDELVRQCCNQISVLKSSFITLSALCIKSVFKEDARQMSFLLEKYANFTQVVQCQTVGELNDIFSNLITDICNYKNAKNSDKKAIVNKVFSFISENYQNSVSLDDIAKCVYLSPAYLSALIVNETGRSFIDILNGVRINKAMELLKDKNNKIAEIAYSCGFNGPPYFTVIFKKLTGYTPSDYRNIV